MRTLLLLISIIGGLLAGCPAGSTSKPADGAPITSAQAAVARAQDALHVSASVAGERAPAGPDVARIPFVPAPAQVWRLTGTTEKLLPANKNIAGFELTLDAQSGALVTWQSVPADPSQRIGPPIPDRVALEARMAATSSRYVGLPTTPPKLGLPELLARASQQGFADLTHAREIRIKRVLQKTGDEPAAAVWVINLRGMRPLPGKGPGATLPAEERSHLRLVYDDDGKLLFADNLLE